MILKLVLRCDWKLSVGRIQTGHTNLLPPQVCGRSWRECRLGVHTCLLQLIALLDIKHPSNYSFEHSFVYYWLVCIIFIGLAFIDTETCPQVWLQIFSGTYANQKYGFPPPHFCGRSWKGCQFLWFKLLPSMHWLDSRQFHNFFKFSVV